MDRDQIRQLASFLKDSKSTVFFGGAGVSTESGVKDYRSEDGLYNTVKKYGISPETILSHSFFTEHPDVFYDFYHTWFLGSTPEPNAAHRVLAKLESEGRLDAVITQNIDGLHQAAGSRNVIELHGTIFRYHCAHCHREYPLAKVREQAGQVPKCEACGGIIKPDVVLYEESLDEDTITAAIRAIRGADFLLIGGTSLAVYPAAGFLRYFKGRHIALINRDPTSYDNEADLVLRNKIGEVLSAAYRAMAEM